MKTSTLLSPARLANDERGAIMVIAVFMAVFSVGILYYAVGIGQTILLREHLQDAADASALSGAIMHARGMNFLVLLNIVMAALLAILVAMKALEGLAILGMIIALAMAWFTGGSSLGLIPPLESLQQTMNNAYETVKPPVFQALELLHDTADIVKDIVPDVAQNIVLAEAGAHGVPSAQGVFWQPRADLPVQDDGFDTLCGKAGELAAGAVTAPIGKIPGIGRLGLGDVVGGFTSSLSSWFCGDSGDPPPKAKRSNVETHFPQSTLAQECANGADPIKPPASSTDLATTDACNKSLEEADAGAPDDHTGGCRSDGDCAPNGAYERLAATAFAQCDPSGSPRPTTYIYQVRHASVPYQWTRAGWKRLEPIFDTPKNESSDRPPCGRPQDHPTIAVGYNGQIHPHADLIEIVPVCSKEGTPSASGPRMRTLGEIERVSRVEVVHILRCVKYLDQSAAVKGMATAKSDGGGSKSPKMILSDATLGDPDFQIRTFVTAVPPEDEAGTMLHRLFFGLGATVKPIAEGALGSLGAAQSEYFYDATGGRGDWMWNMNWRARLTRFRLPIGDGTVDQCKGLCADLVNRLRPFDGLFGH